MDGFFLVLHDPGVCQMKDSWTEPYDDGGGGGSGGGGGFSLVLRDLGGFAQVGLTAVQS